MQETLPPHLSNEDLQLLSNNDAVRDVLLSPQLPEVLRPFLTPEYFQKKCNNFHLRLYHDPSVRALYTTETPEMQDFLATEQGEKVSKFSSYAYVTIGSETINYFLSTSPLSLSEYIYELIVETELKLQKLGIPAPSSLVDTYDQEEFAAVLHTYLSADPAQVLSWTFSRELAQQIAIFFDLYFKRPTKEGLNAVQFLAFQNCFAAHLQAPWIHDMFSQMTPSEAEEYIWVRYFR